MVSTLATQSRRASLTASLSVRLPEVTGSDLGAEQPHPEDVESWRSVSISPMYTTHSRPNSAAAVAVATPCWPAPVSATRRGLPISHREQALAEDVVDLVGAGVGEVLTLEQSRTPSSSRVARIR